MNELFWRKEWDKIRKKEEKYLKNKKEKNNNVTDFIEEKIPDKVGLTLEKAFGKAFMFTLDHGTKLIEKTYDKEEIYQDFLTNESSLQSQESKQSARIFSQYAKKSSRKNIVVSGVKGVGLGFFGVGMPDIPLFVSLILKSVYEISLHYGYDYSQDKERFFLLNTIYTGLLSGDLLEKENASLNLFIQKNQMPPHYEEKIQVELLSSHLANEVLCMKFVQGIPMFGMVGGVSDVIFMEKLLKYVKLKYQRRFVYEQLQRNLVQGWETQD